MCRFEFESTTLNVDTITEKILTSSKDLRHKIPVILGYTVSQKNVQLLFSV